MPPTEAITLSLDRPRELRWTNRSEFLLGSVERPTTYSDLVHKNSHRAFHALCIFVWAALANRDHPFASPSDVAEFLGTREQQAGALTAVVTALRAAGVLEKKTPANGSGSGSGPSPSSSSARPARSSKTAAQPSGRR